MVQALSFRRNVVSLLAAAVALLTTGCDTALFQLALLDEYPAELTYVIENADSFAPEDDDPLAEVAAGTVMDDLSGLSGCWGTHFSMVSPIDDTGLHVYQYLFFDADSEKLTRYSLQDMLGRFPVVDLQSGKYSVAEDGRLTFKVTEFLEVDPITVVMTGGRFDNILPDWKPLEYEILVTLSGDRLKAVFQLPDDDPAMPAGFADREMIYQRFDCLD